MLNKLAFSNPFIIALFPIIVMFLFIVNCLFENNSMLFKYIVALFCARLIAFSNESIVFVHVVSELYVLFLFFIIMEFSFKLVVGIVFLYWYTNVFDSNPHNLSFRCVV